MSNQPYGLPEIKLGAKNRMSYIELIEINNFKYNEGDSAVLISIENGIVFNGTYYEDIAVVLVDDEYGRKTERISQEVRIPRYYDTYVLKALEKGSKSTFGSLVEQAYGLLPGTWYQHVANTTRESQILSAFNPSKNFKI